MKLCWYLTLSVLIMNAFVTHAQTPPTSVDLNKFSGKWYVIGLIPTRFDKDWEYTTETYTLNKKKNIDVFTTYVKEGKTEVKSVTSKGFPDEKANNVKWKVQFVWPFKADYLIEEVDDSYSYTVVGHPKKKFLYIMNRTGKMDETLYNDIIKRFREQGYDMTEFKKMKQ
jgi:apolipoprotein D and lipocalin family protein